MSERSTDVRIGAERPDVGHGLQPRGDCAQERISHLGGPEAMAQGNNGLIRDDENLGHVSGEIAP
jgi:hypothetical protein